MHPNLPALILYCVVAAVHLFFCLYQKDSLPRAITKCLMMPLLLLLYLLTAQAVSPWIIAAILLGWGGDIFLLIPGKKVFFLAGLSSFLLGHAAYVAEIIQRLGAKGGLSWPVLACLAAIFLLIGIAAYFSLHKHLKSDMKAPVIAYLVVILTMATCAGCYAFPFQGGLAPNFVFFGALFFVLSDYMLARSLFISEKKYSTFIVMLTYLAAQLLLVLGLCA